MVNQSKYDVSILRMSIFYHLKFLVLACLCIAMPAKANLPQVIVGYQGWFGCPDDFDGNKHWQHWFVGAVKVENFTVDMFPDLSELSAVDQCDTGINRADGQNTIKLFSSQNPRVVDMHVRWMAQNGIGAIALQRFVGVLTDPAKLRRADNVLENIRRAAAKYGVSYYVVYDVSGAQPQSVASEIWKDWQYLQLTKKITNDQNYLQYKSKPFVQIWGFGFSGHPGQPAEVLYLIRQMQIGQRNITPSSVAGGVPTYWRSLTRDSYSDPIWRDVYAQYDVISPWTVGRFANAKAASTFAQTIIKDDLQITQRRNQAYLPVVFPGFSWANLMRVRGEFARSIPNQIPRQCGDFLRTQIRGVKSFGLTSIYAAMFDELDEATALMPILADRQFSTITDSMVHSNQDGCDLPKNWYLKILR